MNPAQALHDTTHAAVPVIAETFVDDWWVVGSAAAALSGCDAVVPADIDILCSVRDADALRQVWAAHIDASFAPRDDDRFRSRFARFVHLPLPLEVMGGLQVNGAGGWSALFVQATRTVKLAGHVVPVPTIAEQIRVLQLFGRDKDLARVAQLTRHGDIG